MIKECSEERYDEMLGILPPAVDKNSWLRLADDWIDIAEADEERRAKSCPRAPD